MNIAVAFWSAEEKYAVCTSTPQKLKKYVALAKEKTPSSGKILFSGVSQDYNDLYAHLIFVTTITTSGCV